MHQFEINGETKQLKFVETVHIKDGVDCDVYAFVGDNSMDLGVITVAPHKSTPRQKILLGDATIEGFLSGKGRLKIEQVDGTVKEYKFPDSTKSNEVMVEVGQVMQWIAGESGLKFYEVCKPPYAEGRYENLKDNEGE